MFNTLETKGMRICHYYKSNPSTNSYFWKKSHINRCYYDYYLFYYQLGLRYGMEIYTFCLAFRSRSGSLLVLNLHRGGVEGNSFSTERTTGP